MSVIKSLSVVALSVSLGFLSPIAAQAKSLHHHRLTLLRAHHSHRSPFVFRTAARHRVLRTLPGDKSNRAGSSLIAMAEHYIGTNPTGQRSLWCADFANLVLRQAHRAGTGSRLAKSFLTFPRTSPHTGAIAVMGRRGGGHVGFVAGFDRAGNPLIISGNSRGHSVAASVYDRRRILKYVQPI